MDMTPEELAIEAHRLYRCQTGKCAGCCISLPLRLLERDRMIPEAQGGTYERGNVQLLCSHCNKVKGHRSMEFLKNAVRTREGMEQLFRKLEVRL